MKYHNEVKKSKDIRYQVVTEAQIPSSHNGIHGMW